MTKFAQASAELRFSLIVLILDLIFVYVSEPTKLSSLKLMTPEDRFKKRVNDLMQSGCSLDEAFQIASQEFKNLADQADRLLRLKQQIEWERRFGQ